MMENGHNFIHVYNYISPSESFEAENVNVLNNTRQASQSSETSHHTRL
jgi:hypothetical protein